MSVLNLCFSTFQNKWLECEHSTKKSHGFEVEKKRSSCTKLRDVHLQAVAEKWRFEPVGRILLLQRGWGSLQHPTQAAAHQQRYCALQVHQPHPGECWLRKGHPRHWLSKVRRTCRRWGWGTGHASVFILQRSLQASGLFLPPWRGHCSSWSSSSDAAGRSLLRRSRGGRRSSRWLNRGRATDTGSSSRELMIWHSMLPAADT